MFKIKYFIFAFVLVSIQAFSQEWQTDIEDSKQLASAENKVIILVFQGSDWCGPCMKLDREIWSTKEFQDLAEDKLVMLKADFPRRKKNKLSDEQQKHNNQLAEKYNSNGYFPFVIILDSKGNELGSMGYEKSTPKDYFKKLIAFAN
jgi:thioredoxin-related protein